MKVLNYCEHEWVVVCLADAVDEYLDAYHSIDASVEVLMRSLRENPPQTTATDDDGDDYEDDDYYDDDYDEADDTSESDDDDASDDQDDDKFDDHLDSDERSEEEEDESILDVNVDRKVNRENHNDDQGMYKIYTGCGGSLFAHIHGGSFTGTLSYLTDLDNFGTSKFWTFR